MPSSKQGNKESAAWILSKVRPCHVTCAVVPWQTVVVHTRSHSEQNMAALSHSSALFSPKFSFQVSFVAYGTGSTSSTRPDWNVGTDQYKLSRSVEGTEWILKRTSKGRFECIQTASLSHMSVHGEGIKKKSKGVAAWRWAEEKWLNTEQSALFCVYLCARVGLPSAASCVTIMRMLCFSSSCFFSAQCGPAVRCNKAKFVN